MICVGASRSFVVVEPHTTLSTSVPGIFFTNFAPALGASFLLVADTVSSNSVWQYRRNPTTNLRPRLRVTELQKANRNFSPEVQVGQRGLLNSTVCSPGSDYCDIEGVDEQWPVPLLASNHWSVRRQEAIHEVNSTHALVVQVDKVRLRDLSVRHILYSSSHLMERKMAQPVAGHRNDGVVVPLANVHFTIRTVIELSSSSCLQVLCTFHQLRRTSCAILSNRANSSDILLTKTLQKSITSKEVVEEQLVALDIRFLLNDGHHMVHNTCSKWIRLLSRFLASVDLQVVG